MSNFAERLVARGAGQVPGSGLAFLAPRPAARFEPPTSGGFEEAGDVERRSEDAGRVADADATRVDPTIATPAIPSRGIPGADVEVAIPRAVDGALREPRPVRDTVGPPPVQAQVWPPLPRSGELPISHHAGERAEVAGIAESGTSARPSAAAPRVTSIDASEVVRPGPSVVLPRSHDEHAWSNRESPPRSARVSETAAVTREPGRSNTVPSLDDPRAGREAPPPAISIGKIEVQFLPQEPRVPAPRSEPQRTRGFEAYARARRGEPR